MSVLEPHPTQFDVGFVKVVSTKVQLSPLWPQVPEQEEISGNVQYLNICGIGSYPFEGSCTRRRAVSKKALVCLL